jgi:RNA polymerase sigma factor (sigma-70 family)
MIMDRLKECRRMVKRTRWLDARLMELQCGTERTTSVRCKTPPESEDYIALEEQLDKITGYERHYSAQLIEAMQEIMELDGWLQQLPERHEDVMRLRYIDARSWSEVAKEVGYSEAHCYTLHHDAIALLETIEQKNGEDDLCVEAAPLQTA